LLFVTIAPAFSYLGVYYFKYNALKSLQKQQLTLVTKLANEINTKLMILTRVLNSEVSNINPIVFQEKQSADEYIKKYASLNAVFDDNILLFNENGHLLSESGDNSSDRIGMSFMWRDYIRIPKETHKTYISAPLKAAASLKLTKPMVVICAPVIRNDKLLGFIAGAVNLFNINIFNNNEFTKLYDDGWVYVIDSNGKIIMHPSESKITTKIDSENNPIMKLVKKNKYGVFSYDENNKTIQASFAKVPISDWAIVANYRSDSIFIHIYRAERTLFALLILGGIVVIAIVSFIMRGLINPILSLKEQAENILASSSDNQLIHVSSNDEIMETANAFNRLLIEMNKKKYELKSKNEIMQTICDFSKDWVYWINDKGHMVYISPAAESITGYSIEELSDYPQFYERIILQQDQEKWLRLDRAVRMDENVNEVDIRIVRNDGTIRWLHNSCRGFFENDKFIGVRGVFTDISTAKGVEKQLFSRENVYKLVLENSGEPIIFTDNSLNITECNEKAAALTNCSVGSSLNEYLEIIPEVSMSTDDQIQVAESGFTSVTGEVYYLWFSTELSIEKHGMDGFIFMGIDITAKKKREAEFNKMEIKTEIDKYTSHMEAIIKSVSDGILSFDNNKKLLFYNKKSAKMFMLNPEDIGEKIENIKLLAESEIMTLVNKAFKSDNSFNTDRIELPSENGGLKLNIKTTPLVNSENKKFGVLVTIIEELDLNRFYKKSQFPDIVGSGDKMQTLFSMMSSLAEVDSTVLILGESGTGKELVAEGIHKQGNRSGKPLVKLNCSAIPENLLESELFGYVKGAFTGAYKNKQGKFETANGGTIFLDEIGDITPNVQVRLLRVLQEKEIEVIGLNEPVKVDVRIIAATNKNLKAMVANGDFREDLYYRLNVVTLFVPPLRERREDILPIAYSFINKFNEKLNKNIIDFTEKAKKFLVEYDWPGNVRELEHVIEYACLMEQTSFISLDKMPKEVVDSVVDLLVDDKEAILSALREAKGSKTKAAKILNISRATLYRKLQEYDIDYKLD